ncbi:MAG TPA: exopolyphosphatase, partial [Thermodesulfobacteriota bacterium]|nr:exopolyphosphatase [Thermodesulfobacteriota bacterium]
RLTVKGVLNNVSFNTPGCLIFDIGGGSTEYVYVNDGKIMNITSTGLGVVRLTEKYLADENDTEADMAALDAHIESVITEALPSFPQGGDETLTLIGTAGTPTTLAAMELRLAAYDPVLVNNYVLTREKIERTLKTVLSLPRADRTKIPGLEKGREDLIVSGTAVVLKTMERFMSGRMAVSDAGLLEGIAYSMVGGGKAGR